MPIFFARPTRLSGILGRPSANRSPFHSDVKKINSSFEIVCGKVDKLNPKRANVTVIILCFIIFFFHECNFSRAKQPNSTINLFKMLTWKLIFPAHLPFAPGFVHPKCFNVTLVLDGYIGGTTILSAKSYVTGVFPG